jgi:hypothetical protein
MKMPLRNFELRSAGPSVQIIQGGVILFRGKKNYFPAPLVYAKMLILFAQDAPPGRAGIR